MEKRFVIFIVAVSLAFFGIKLVFENKDAKDKEAWLKNSEVVAQKEDSERIETEKRRTRDKSFSQGDQKEKFFVLENESEQVVFSNHGGSIVEINLPFKSETNKISAVFPIEFDREILQQSPENALFPLNQSETYERKQQETKSGGYYPLIRRGIKNSTTQNVPYRYRAFSVVSNYPEVAELIYDVKSFTKNEIVFESSLPHRRITKKFTLFPADKAPYCIQLDVKVEGENQGLSLTSGVPEVEWISGSTGSSIKYQFFKGNSSVVEKIDLPKEKYSLTSLVPNWISNSNGFFGIILDPLKGSESGFSADKVDGSVDPSRLTLIDQNRFPASDLPGYEVTVPLKSSSQTMQFRIFAGPFADRILNQVDDYFSNQPDGKKSDYLASQSYHGWFAFISEPFAKFLFFLMKIFYSICGSWGISIVLLTIALRIMLYPLNTWSLRSMKKMQMLAPELKAIQERYKKDPQKAQLETINLYRTYGVNPISGCLPLLIQMPFLIGMFDLLKSTFELRGAPFIPGWIDNLSAPDVLFRWNFSIPIIGNEFHLLPILLGVIMYLQQNMMSPLPKNPKEWTEQQRQQRVMGNIMTVVMTVLFYQFPSGLNIYWISSMLLGMLQQWWLNRSTTNMVVLPAQTTKKSAKNF